MRAFHYFFVVLSLLLMAAPFSSGQAPSLPSSGKTDIRVPKEFRDGVLRESDAIRIISSNNLGKTGNTKEYWVVYSDRQDNITYKESTGSAKYTTLEFNQRVRIADIKNGRALVYEDLKPSDRRWPKLPVASDEYICYGWVPLSNLLLWDTCPADDKGIYNKALLSLNLDAAGGRGRTEKDAHKCYMSPDGSGEKKYTLDEKIYYIMKREGSMVLLSTQYTLGDGSVYKVLAGWFKPISFVEWNQRSCLEPTWDEDDVLYFANQGVWANVYDGPNSSTVASYWDFKKLSLPQKANNESIYHGRVQLPYRVSKQFRRFPILGREKNGRYHVTSFSTNGKKEMEMSSGNELAEADLKKLQQINLVVAIDGTKSMEAFYEPVIKGIQEGCANLQQIRGTNIKVGAVIYRDKTDVKGGKSYEIEKTEKLVSISDASFIDFLRKGGEYGVKSSSRDPDMEESLFKGIDTAIDFFEGKEKESNILLVVGDCGNKIDDNSQKALVNKLTKYNVQTMGYQVRIDSNPRNRGAFTAFTSQMFDLVSESIKGIYQNQKRPSDYAKFKLTDNSYEMSTTKGRTHQGSVKSPLDKSEMKTEELTKYLFETIRDAQDGIQTQLNSMVAMAYGGGGAMEYDDNFVRSRGFDPEKIRNSVSFQGWTEMEDKRSGRALYKTVLFISAVEFQELMHELDKVPTGGNNTARPDRLAFVNAMKDLAARHVGESGADIDKMSMKELNALIYGLHAKSESLGSTYSLQDILEPRKVSDSEFSKMLERFRRKHENLRKINKNYQGYYEFNGAKWYWIPIEDLP